MAVGRAHKYYEKLLTYILIYIYILVAMWDSYTICSIFLMENTPRNIKGHGMAYFHPIYTSTLKINAKHPAAQTVLWQNTFNNTLYGQHTVCNYDLSQAIWSIEVTKIGIWTHLQPKHHMICLWKRNTKTVHISTILEPISAAAIPISSRLFLWNTYDM